ncbi:MAG TPA: DNA cytosine methyltransferase [Negativicutes bacterium]|nr:DNA cytosine methyltransferase [Negativicutes bacterium]
MPCVVVDLFCGIGGLTKGLELAGLNVVAGIDIDATCQFAYEENNNSRFIHEDVTNVTAEQLLALYPEDGIRALVGCAPCQPFSKYSLRYRKEGHVDEKWRLLYSFSRVIRESNPHIVSMENVPELSNEAVFQDFVNSLTELGYNVDWHVVYCPEYGVPQNRKRLVLLASRIGNITLIPPLYEQGNYPTVRQAIGNLPQINAGEQDAADPLHRACILSDTNLRRIRLSVPGGTWRDWDEALQLPCHKKNTGKTYPSVYGRMCWDEPAPTITTQFYGYGNGRFGHPEQDRALSLREGAILQSFPPAYVFVNAEHPATRRELGIHIGNAVPVELGRAIGISIQNHIREVEENGED